ncbi:sensor histidine kinase [Asticcacaulis biprosthecium]|uniref:sensor histidine kinase n=1 Tax=Asticcacaulis biprosthecium TaxID=76891 RepID=UPI000682DA17|nr:HAMP domain-containing sensor histidine kinase [Asticcacaulis biprosthecium]
MTVIALETSNHARADVAQGVLPVGHDQSGLGYCDGHDTPQCGLSAERKASALREQFIAVLGHDLRNPLSAIISGMDIMALSPMDERQVMVARLVQSSASRMSALIDDVLDFARGRLGDGMSLTCEPVYLGPALVQVIDELRSSHAKRQILADIKLPERVDCDPGRLSQLLSNLVANALVHGSETGPISIRARCDKKGLNLSVANSGDPIPQAAIARLFQPFTRDEIRPSQQGLGLGLYIASEIARAHGGQLEARSDQNETRFTFRMPLNTPEVARQPS